MIQHRPQQPPLRPAPATTAGGGTVTAGGERTSPIWPVHNPGFARPSPSRGRFNVLGACAPCRSAKKKCDGCRPLCNACKLRGLGEEQCTYAQLEGLSRAETLKRTLQAVTNERDFLQSIARDLIGLTPKETIRRYLGDAFGDGSSRALDIIYPRSCETENADLREYLSKALNGIGDISHMQIDGASNPLLSSMVGLPTIPSKPLHKHMDFRTYSSHCLPNAKEIYDTISVPPEHTLRPLIQVGDDSPLSKAIINFLELAQHRIAEGWPIDSVLGPVRFDVSRILTSPDCGGYDPDFDEFTVPGWATSILLTFQTDKLDIFVRLSAVLLLARLMRWWVMPTADNYALLGEILRPTALQRRVPHPAEYEIVLFPIMRDALISRPREFVIFAHEWYFLWDRDKAYVEYDSTSDIVHVTAEFEASAMCADNWAFGPDVFKVFPEFAGRVKAFEQRGVKVP